MHRERASEQISAQFHFLPSNSPSPLCCNGGGIQDGSRATTARHKIGCIATRLLRAMQLPRPCRYSFKDATVAAALVQVSNPASAADGLSSCQSLAPSLPDMLTVRSPRSGDDTHIWECAMHRRLVALLGHRLLRQYCLPLVLATSDCSATTHLRLPVASRSFTSFSPTLAPLLSVLPTLSPQVMPSNGRRQLLLTVALQCLPQEAHFQRRLAPSHPCRQQRPFVSLLQAQSPCLA